MSLKASPGPQYYLKTMEAIGLKRQVYEMLPCGNNIFNNYNNGVWGTAVIQVGSGVKEEYRSLSRDIKIYNNSFNVFDPGLIHNYSVGGLLPDCAFY
jgi:hypothetical protein